MKNPEAPKLTPLQLAAAEEHKANMEKLHRNSTEEERREMEEADRLALEMECRM